VRYEAADRAWFTALTRFIPRRRWAGVFPVTLATLLALGEQLELAEQGPGSDPGRDGVRLPERKGGQ
jgi:hypothetical protein